MRQEKVSRMLAVLRGSSLKRRVISLAMRPVVMMAMVLFAVHRLARLTSPAMLNSAPRFPLMLLVNPLTMKSIPPFSLITSSIPPASIVTMMRSPIPLMPPPMDSRNSDQSRLSPEIPMTPFTARPMVSTAATFIPEMARAMTNI